ncbi:MAG: hypothetical protein ACM3N4_02905 [Nitrososphaerota archaeon]
MTSLTSPEPSPRTSLNTFWHRTIYRNIFGLVAGVSTLFIVLTTMAMLLYPGGADPVKPTHGYVFFINTFSDLGQVHTQSGANNFPSMVLFTSAMIIVGIGLGAFFVVFSRFFASHSTHPWARRVNLLATLVGLGAAVCFIGLGVSPHDQVYVQHQVFTQWAFRLLLLAVILEIVAMRLDGRIPASLLRVNMAFVIILFSYLLLMFYGPAPVNLIGDEIHAVAQKLIVYTSVITIFVQALLMRAHLARPLAAVSATQGRPVAPER